MKIVSEKLKIILKVNFQLQFSFKFFFSGIHQIESPDLNKRHKDFQEPINILMIFLIDF